MYYEWMRKKIGSYSRKFLQLDYPKFENHNMEVVMQLKGNLEVSIDDYR